jgi:hypothetical protein
MVQLMHLYGSFGLEAIVINDKEIKFRFKDSLTDRFDVADLIANAGVHVDSLSTAVTTDVTNACVEAGLVANKYYY